MLRRTLYLIACWSIALPANADLSLAADLAGDGRSAKITGTPIVVLFSTENCPYCTKVKQLYLNPLLTDQEYVGKVILREVRADDTQLIDFVGNPSSHEKFSSAQQVSLVPTVRFFAPGGQRIAADIVGTSIDDFYWAYLRNNIESARDFMGLDQRLD